MHPWLFGGPPAPVTPGQNIPGGVIVPDAPTGNNSVLFYIVTVPQQFRYIITATGTVTLDLFFTGSNAFGAQSPTAGSTLIQWLRADPVTRTMVPLPGGRIQGPPFTITFDTTSVADGTHGFMVQVLDTTWVPIGAPSNWSAYYIVMSRALPLIIHNSGYNDGAQTVPTLDQAINWRFVPNLVSDFVTYPGSGEPNNTIVPYPSIASPPSSSPTLRQADPWYVARLTAFQANEYESVERYMRPSEGHGAAVEGYDPQGGITIEDAYNSSIRHRNLGGGRLNATVEPYSVFVGHPTQDYWVGCDLSGRVYTIDQTGVTTVLAGLSDDRTLLPFDYLDGSVSEDQLDEPLTEIGTITGTDWRGLNDICFDPRDLTYNTIYLAKPTDNVILKVVNLTTAPSATIYAGQAGVAGYVDGAVGSSLLNFPTSITMSSAGILYIADEYNHVIRTVNAAGTTVGTLVGKQPPPSEAVATFQYFFTGGISDGAGNAGTILDATSATGTPFLIGQEFQASPSQTAISPGLTITSQIDGTPGGAGHYHVSSSVFVAPGTGLQVMNLGIYSSPTTQSFANAYIVAPFVIRLDQNGNIVLGESWTGCCRRINLQNNTVSRVSYFVAPLVNAFNMWAWLDVDVNGTSGPAGDIIWFISDSFGSAEYVSRFDTNGGNTVVYGPTGLYLTEGPFISGGVINPPTHYPWGVAFSKVAARILFNGFGNQFFSFWRLRNSSDPPVNPNAGIGFDQTTYINGRTIQTYGSVPNYPFLSRPSWRLLRGPAGYSFLGNMTFEDIVTAYPTDAALAAFIQGGMGGAVPRPEITGNDLRDFIYFIRYTALSGHYPTTVNPGPTNPDATPPVNANVVASRLSSTSIQVSWTTNKSTIGFAMAGRVAGLYTLWALETTFGTSHSVIITNLPTGPMHYSVYSKDIAGNHSTWTDQVIP